ncbi:hypothetical protein J6590_015071 [Homalodisca vitripennis]|nr:hypothetical protein J6590_015071 [Homalodisca vitripennis]
MSGRKRLSSLHLRLSDLARDTIEIKRLHKLSRTNKPYSCQVDFVAEFDVNRSLMLLTKYGTTKHFQKFGLNIVLEPHFTDLNQTTWLLLGCVTAEESRPCKQPTCPAVGTQGDNQEIDNPDLIPNLRPIETLHQQLNSMEFCTEEAECSSNRHIV